MCFLEVNPMGMWETQKIGYPRVFNSQVSSHSDSSNLNYWVSVLSSLWLEWCLLQVSRSQLWFSVFASLSRFQGSSLTCDLSSLRNLRIIGFQFVYYYLVENGNDNL